VHDPHAEPTASGQRKADDTTASAAGPIYDGLPGEIQRLRIDRFRERADYDPALCARLAAARHLDDALAARRERWGQSTANNLRLIGAAMARSGAEMSGESAAGSMGEAGNDGWVEGIAARLEG